MWAGQGYINTAYHCLKMQPQNPALQNLGSDMLMMLLGQCDSNLGNSNHFLINDFQTEVPPKIKADQNLWCSIVLVLQLTAEQQKVPHP